MYNQGLIFVAVFWNTQMWRGWNIATWTT